MHRDFPVGHPGNCSHNPAHPFNVIVAALERAGADILFAAGNSGVTGSNGHCVSPDPGTPAAVGTNHRPAALAVGGGDVAHAFAGVCSREPGVLRPVPLGFRQRYPRLCELLRDPRIRLKLPLPDLMRPGRAGAGRLSPSSAAAPEADEEDELIAALVTTMQPLGAGPRSLPGPSLRPRSALH